jgi:hypothetical protein
VSISDAQYSRGLDNKRRPPIVRFSRAAQFDAKQTEKNGRSTYIDVDMVKVTSPDGGVTLEKNVKQWFAEIDKKPEYMQWTPYFKQMYRDWQEAHDVASVEGTHLSNWPLLSPGQVETLLNAGVKTIEDAAGMPDDLATALAAHYIRSKARYWLNAAEDIGAVSAKAASLEAENETLQADVIEKSKKIAELKGEVERLTQHFTGKDGYDIISGRAEAVPLKLVQETSQAQPALEVRPVESTTPVLPQGETRLSLEQVQTLGMSQLRDYCYENNVQPHTSKQTTIERLIEAEVVA